MNSDTRHAVDRSPHDELTGTLQSTWRRSAGQAGCAARDPARNVWPWLLVCATTIGVLGFGAGAATGAAVPLHPGDGVDSVRGAQTRADAARALLTRRYADAYGRFAALADEGDAAAALMALAMVCNGNPVFGSEWSATPGQLQRWSALAARAVRERGDAIADHDRGE